MLTAQITQGLTLPPTAQSTNAAAEAPPLNWEYALPNLYPPANADLIADNCAQVRRVREVRNTGEKIKEPYWRECLGVLVYTDNGDSVAHAWSSGDPRYTFTQTQGKLDKLREKDAGPTLCTTLESRNPGGCEGCTHKGEIKSPIRMGTIRHVTPEVSPPVNLPPAPPVAPQSQGVGGVVTAPYIAQNAALAFGAPAAATPQRLFDLSEANVRNFLMTAPPPRRYLLKDCLPVGKVGAIIAPGGTGKSQFVLQLAISIASGLPLAGGAWEVGESGGVLALFAEDDSEEVGRRLHYEVAPEKRTS